MNKVLHALVYLFLILSAVALWFEIELNKTRETLSDRNRLQEDYVIRIAGTVEKVEPNKDATAELKKDVSPVAAEIVDTPATVNVLDGYNAYLEQANLETYSWNNDQTKKQLRSVYALDFEGKIAMDGNIRQMDGPGTEQELLKQLYKSSQNMQTKLNNTRAELVKLHRVLEEQVAEINKLKPEARQDKVTIVEKNEKITKLEKDKAELDNQLVKTKAQVDELNTEITSLKDEVVTAQNETEAAKDELQKSQKLVEQLRNLIASMVQQQPGGGDKGGVATIPAGDKGSVIEADNESMFVVVKFSDRTMKELKGDNLDRPIPNLEFGVKRKGFKGAAGEFVGRIRVRQEVRDKNYVICDILGAWSQDDADGIKIGDVIFAD